MANDMPDVRAARQRKVKGLTRRQREDLQAAHPWPKSDTYYTEADLQRNAEAAADSYKATLIDWRIIHIWDTKELVLQTRLLMPDGTIYLHHTAM